MSTKPLAERFWKHVKQGGRCWTWTGATAKFGYGVIWGGRSNDTNMLAHRVSWEVNVGPIPNGMCVLHKCDNPPCVRPEHLFLGTKTDNNRDRDAKGRCVPPPRSARRTIPRGERHGNAVLTADKVRAIRSAVGRYREIGKQFGVSNTTVRMIKIGRAWAHVS